ncbi:hypothetical protein JXA12_02165 [Candidatus Woesearchaeota archaeon]|nr:hypothetical protein [Candidatus Woesearchaeota archaeon]
MGNKRELPFKNGDKVRCWGGLVYTFVGLDPFDSSYAYCAHLNATYCDDEGVVHKRLDRLLVDKLELQRE